MMPHDIKKPVALWGYLCGSNSDYERVDSIDTSGYHGEEEEEENDDFVIVGRGPS
jgi:hypothetical protein